MSSLLVATAGVAWGPTSAAGHQNAVFGVFDGTTAVSGVKEGIEAGGRVWVVFAGSGPSEGEIRVLYRDAGGISTGGTGTAGGRTALRR